MSESEQKTRTVAYLRVSLEKQAEAASLDVQRAKVRAYADLYGLELVAIEEEVGSARSLDRPGLQKVLGMLKAGAADALLVSRLDRLTRSVRDLCDLVDRYFRDGRYALLSVGEQVDTRSAAGRMVLSILATISQWEREAIGERTAAAMKYMAGRGEFCGGNVPYGYRLAGEMLEENPGEQAVVRAARALREQGFSLRDIAVLLRNKGLRSRTGREFGANQIARMVAA